MQRLEATFLSVANFCRKTSTILNIVRDLEQMASTQAINSEQKALRVMLNTRIAASNGFVCPMAASVCARVTDFARSLVTAQAAQLVLCPSLQGQKGRHGTTRARGRAGGRGHSISC
jgi:hypothetical protein